jgi:serine/threonine-protein kinase
MPLATGDAFVGFTIVPLLGSGDIETVYLARFAGSPRPAPLTGLRVDVSSDPDFREPFTHDAGIAARVVHPHSCALT